MLRFALCLVALFLFVSGASAAQLLVNGDFETGDFTGWAQSGWFIDSLNPNSGVYDVSTGCSSASCTTPGDSNSAYIYESFTTTIGAAYGLSFFYNSGQDPTFGSELLVLWGDPAATSFSIVSDFVNVDTSGAYAHFSGTLTATSTTSTLGFLGRQDLDFYYVDDVSLTSTAPSVPEPRSWALVLTGLAFIGIRRVSACN